MSSTPSHPDAHLMHLHDSNCRFQDLPYDMASADADPLDFRSALLQFMIAATPKDKVVNDILANFDGHIDKMVVTQTQHLTADDGQTLEMTVDNVPDAVSPVKARLAYIQVPTQQGPTELNLVWKVRHHGRSGVRSR